MKSYKISHEDDHLFHVTHPDGSTFAIAKKAVSPSLVKRIQSFAKGGEVLSPTPDIGNVGSIFESPAAAAAGATPEPLSVEPAAAEPSVTPAAQMPETPGYAQQIAGIKGAARAQMNLGQDQQAALNDYQTKMDDSAKLYHSRRAEIDAEHEKLSQDLKNGQVDPNRYWNNKTTGQKISAGLGLILGGIGAGMTHGPNAALEVMNKAIDNDIESQRADLGKKNTLLQMNLHKYQSLDAAEAATKLQYNTYLQTRLQSAAAKAGATQAGAQLQMQLGALKQQGEVLKQKLVDQQIQAASIGLNQTGEGGIPAGRAEGRLLMDPKYREVRVVVNGKAYQAADKASATTVRGAETLAGPIVDSVQKLNELSKDPSARVPGSEANNLAHALIGDLAVKLPLFSGNTIGAKRINKEEIDHQVARLQDPTKFTQVMGDLKNEEFFKSFTKELESVRSNHLIGYKGSGDFGFKPVAGKLPRN